MPPKAFKKQLPADFPGPVQVIAAGLPRCATSTLQEMFEQHLQVGPCMHMKRCMPYPPNMKMVYSALIEKDKTKRQAILAKLMQGCAASADFPGHIFIEDFVEMYPDAKFILNIRKGNGQDWSDSMATTIAPFVSRKYQVACYWSTPDYWHYKAEAAWQDLVIEKFGVKSHSDPELYEKHNEWVKKVMADHGKQLLVWEPSMGWEPICEFLGKDVPSFDIPRTNERAAMEKMITWRINVGVQQWTKVVAAPLAITVAASAIATMRFMRS